MEEQHIDVNDPGFGAIHPSAPQALSWFAFLVGRWRCEARVLLGNDWRSFGGSWVGRYILDGYAIEDEFRITGAAGEVIVLGISIRSYDAAHQSWHMKWLNAAGAWTDLGPEELGGVRFEGESITYTYKEPVAGHGLTRATFSDISDLHFSWRGEMSEDGVNWTEFIRVEGVRE